MNDNYDDVLAAALLIVKDAGDVAGRLGPRLRRLPNILGSLMTEAGDEPVQLRAVDD